MSEENKEKLFAKDYLTFRQGQDSLINDQDSLHEGLEKVKNIISDLTNIKNLHFLLGAGVSSSAIPAMKELLEIISKCVASEDTKATLEAPPSSLKHEDLIALYGKVKDFNQENLENILGTLYSKKTFLAGIGDSDPLTSFLIKLIESQIYNSINIDTTGYWGFSPLKRHNPL